MSAVSGFPVTLDITKRLCVVIGGGEEAAEKAQRLVDAEGLVMVVNPTLNIPLRKMTAAGKVIHRGRRFRSTDTHEAFLVCNTIPDDPDLAKSLYELSKEQKFLLWSIDQPELSTFMMPAVVNRGRLRLAISTSQSSPALAGALRKDMESIFDEEFAAFLDWLGSAREDLRTSEPNPERRRAKLQELVQGFQLLGQITYPPSWVAEKEKCSAAAQEG